MSNQSARRSEATWWDHHELKFWLWAALTNAGNYLSISMDQKIALENLHPVDLERMQGLIRSLEEVRNRLHLSMYHLVCALGVLIRVLNRSKELFPSIATSINEAKHLFAEGKHIRDMIEHSYGEGGYLHGCGRFRDRFIIETESYISDATSTIVNEDGHWLGGRLCVEKVVKEVLAIQEEVMKLPSPKDDT